MSEKCIPSKVDLGLVMAPLILIFNLGHNGHLTDHKTGTEEFQDLVI